tara:strand:+ start:3966 stop:4352 length:387 start_codon:yes stop_codon:yes gene_type:complete
MNINEVVNWFEKTKSQKIRVNDVEYENKQGISTNSGWYKNGFEAKVINGKQGKRKYLQIYIYTSCKHYVDIEEKFLFAKIGDKYKIVKHLGWNEIDLLKIGKWFEETNQWDWEGMLRAIYNKSKTELD